MGSEPEYNPEQEFGITSQILTLKVSMNDVDAILDRILNGKESDQDIEKMIEYIIQLFYQSGNRRTSMAKVHQKLQKMVEEKAMHVLEDVGLVDFVVDEDGSMVPVPVNRRNNESDLQEG